MNPRFYSVGGGMNIYSNWKGWHRIWWKFRSKLFKICKSICCKRW